MLHPLFAMWNVARTRCCLLTILLASALATSAFPAAGQQPTPVATLLHDSNRDGTPEREGQRVVVEGVINAPVRPAGSRYALATLQDSTGGVLIFARERALLLGRIRAGDLVRAHGTLKRFRETIEVDVERVDRVRAGPVPPPREVTAAELTRRLYVAQRVRLVGELVPSTTKTGSWQGGNLLFRDPSDQVAVYVPADVLRSLESMARVARGGEATVIGVPALRRDPVSGEVRAQLVVGDLRDIHLKPIPPYRALAVGGAVLLLALLCLYLWRQRRRAERWAEQMSEVTTALAGSEERYALAARGASDGLWDWDLVGGTVYYSPRWKAMLGYSDAEICDHPEEWLSRVHSDDADGLRRALDEHLKGADEHLQCEYRIQTKDGAYRWMLVRGVAVRAEDGTPSRLAGSQTDIHERKRLYTEVRESAEQYRLLFDGNPHPMWVYDPETLVFLAINDTAVREIGYSRQEFLGRTVWDLHLPEDHPALSSETDRISGAPNASAWRILKKDGSLIDVVVDARSIVYGGRSARIALVQDVTDRVRAEESLRESERRLSTLVGNLPGVVYRSRNDSQWTMEYIGGRVEEILGYPPGEMTGEGAVSLAELIHPQDRERVWDQVQLAVHAREPFQLEYRVRAAGGQEKWVWEQGVCIYSEEGDLRTLEGFITDVTRMKQAEEEHRRLLMEQAARTEAEAAQQRIGDILESISDAFFALDEHGHFTYVNTAAERVLARSRGNLLGSSLWEEFPAITGSIFEEKFQEVLTGQRPVEFEAYYPPLRAWLEVRGYPAAEGLAVYMRDVTRRRQTEETLRRSEERFRSLTEHSSDLITVLDAEGHIRYESASLERVLGYTPDELLGRSAFELMHPDDLHRVLAAFQRLMEEPEQTQSAEFRFRHKNGDWRQFESVATNRLQDPAVGGVIANSRDVTARRQSQERLRESEERFRQLAESVREVFWMRDGSLSELLYLSPAYEDVWGRSPEDFFARPDAWMDTISEQDRAHTAAAYAPERVRSGGLDTEYRIVRPDGEVRWIHDRAFPVQDAGGVVYRIAGIAEDITDRKYIEEALQRSQDALEAVLHASPDIVEILSLEGDFQWASPAMHTVLGYEPAEIKGRAMLDLVHSEDRESVETALGELARGTREEIRERFRACHADGRWVVLEASGRAMVRDGEHSLVVVARDVTDQVRLEQASREARAQAERASRAKSDFLSRMSHELRTPMNAILGFAQILEMDVQGDDDKESVEQILRAGRHLLGLLNEVLDLSRIEAGEMGLSVEPVAVREAVIQSVDMVQHMAAQQGITLSADRALGTNSLVAADLQRLKQVLLNLLSNAIKYNRPGGSVTLSCEGMGEDRLRIMVQDTGYGISMEQMERLFVPFERLNAEGSGVEGTGLGLALSRGLMEAMGGTLGVESHEGKGSRFWAELPIATPAGDAAAHGESDPVDPRAEAPTTHTHTVLLVEDNLTNVRLMERVFRRRPQVKLVVAMQGRIGLDLAREHLPSLILLDLNLPDLSGRDVLRRLRADPSLHAVPVVMVSGDAMPEQVERLRAEGARGYITKPFDVMEVLRLVDDALAGVE